MTRLRIALAWICFAAAGYHYAGPAVTAFLGFCTYWTLWKPNPDHPFALIAWPAWYLTGFLTVAAFLHSLAYVEPWGLCAAFVFFEFWVLPFMRRSYAAWAELYNQAARQIASGDWIDARATALKARDAANRIRWQGQEARAATTLLQAQAELKLGNAKQAELLATQALPQFERSRQILGIAPDAVHRIRGTARLANRDSAGAIHDLQLAFEQHRAWAGEDQVLAQILLAEGVAHARTGAAEVAVDRFREALRIAIQNGDEDFAAITRASIGGDDNLTAAANFFLRHGVVALTEHARIAYAVLLHLAGQSRFPEALTLWNKLWATDADRAWLLLTRASILLRAKLYQSAQQAAARATQLFAQRGESDEWAWALILQAQVALALLEWDAAVALAEQADAMLARHGHTGVAENRTTAAEIIAVANARQPDPEWATTPEQRQLDEQMLLPEE